RQPHVVLLVPPNHFRIVEPIPMRGCRLSGIWSEFRAPRLQLQATRTLQHARAVGSNARSGKHRTHGPGLGWAYWTRLCRASSRSHSFPHYLQHVGLARTREKAPRTVLKNRGRRNLSLFILNFNAFVNILVPSGVTRRLSPAEMRAYRGPFPTRASRVPTAISPREILHSREYLAEVESNLAKLSDKPTLILWGDRDNAFRENERERFERLFPDHRTRILKGAKHFVQE